MPICKARHNRFLSPALCYCILQGTYWVAPLMLTFTDGFKYPNKSMMERADRQERKSDLRTEIEVVLRYTISGYPLHYCTLLPCRSWKCLFHREILT